MMNTNYRSDGLIVYTTHVLIAQDPVKKFEIEKR